MDLAYKDLKHNGVVIISSSSPSYDADRAGIEQRLRGRPKGSPPLPQGWNDCLVKEGKQASVLLENKAGKSILGIAFTWTFIKDHNQRTSRHFTPKTSSSALLPFECDERAANVHAFWNKIFPGSKRIVTSDGHVLGDNRDVRQPREGELWRGPFISINIKEIPQRQMTRPIEFVIDGVFFGDGTFVGPNQLRSWEAIVSVADAHLLYSNMAVETSKTEKGMDSFFSQIETFFRPIGFQDKPEPESFESDSDYLKAVRLYSQLVVGRRITRLREAVGQRAALSLVEKWGEAPAPHFRKL